MFTIKWFSVNPNYGEVFKLVYLSGQDLPLPLLLLWAVVRLRSRQPLVLVDLKTHTVSLGKLNGTFEEKLHGFSCCVRHQGWWKWGEYYILFNVSTLKWPNLCLRHCGIMFLKQAEHLLHKRPKVNKESKALTVLCSSTRCFSKHSLDDFRASFNLELIWSLEKRTNNQIFSKNKNSSFFTSVWLVYLKLGFLRVIQQHIIE